MCDPAAQTETTYTYDTAGNILKRTVQDTNGNTSHEDTYTYGNRSWLDMLTAYNGHAIAYEGQTLNSETSVLGTAVSGNPVSYYNGTRWNMTWKKGRQLSTMSKDGTSISYTYDLNGIRKSKTVNGTAYSYITQNGQAVRQTWGSNVLDIVYDNNSAPYAMVYNGTAYYYILNQQGDVVSIIDANKNTVAAYDYDAWGKVLSSTGSLADVNPIRHRGYYYDAETGLYYLRSRYYDPEICRFINADDAEYADLNTNTPEETNLFAYVGNNPVMRMDEDGCLSNGWKLAITGAILVASVAVIVATGSVASGPVMCVAVSASQGAITGAVSGAVSGAAVSAVTGAVKHRMATGSWKGAGSVALKKAKQGAIDGAFSGAISGAVSGAFHPSACFVAGTAVAIASGYAAIETLKQGDLVWSWDEETGDVALKAVVQTFVNETRELIHLKTDGEEIITTPTHPFYVYERGWYAAEDLRAGDILVQVNGKHVIVELVQHEILEAPIKVYNFEVEDYLTYYVGDGGILVHNAWPPKNQREQKIIICLIIRIKNICPNFKKLPINII